MTMYSITQLDAALSEFGIAFDPGEDAGKDSDQRYAQRLGALQAIVDIIMSPGDDRAAMNSLTGFWTVCRGFSEGQDVPADEDEAAVLLIATRLRIIAKSSEHMVLLAELQRDVNPVSQRLLTAVSLACEAACSALYMSRPDTMERMNALADPRDRRSPDELRAAGEALFERCVNAFGAALAARFASALLTAHVHERADDLLQ